LNRIRDVSIPDYGEQTVNLLNLLKLSCKIPGDVENMITSVEVCGEEMKLEVYRLWCKVKNVMLVL
jgi:hypothetical protein